MKFFENGMEGSRTHWVNARGWWYDGSGEGLTLPSDLTAVDLDADKWGEEWSLWCSPEMKRFFCLRYEPRSSEWLGLIMNALTLEEARTELETVQ